MYDQSVGHIEIAAIDKPVGVSPSKFSRHVVDILIEYAKNLGMFFEPEQHFTLDEDINDEASPQSFRIYPEFTPDPIFFPYLQIVLRSLKNLLERSRSNYFKSANNKYFDLCSAIEDLRECALLESEESEIRSCENSCLQKLKLIKTKIEFSFSLNNNNVDIKKYYSFNKREFYEKELVEFENYEFEYQTLRFSLDDNKPSIILIGGNQYDVLFSSDFIDSCNLFINESILERIKNNNYKSGKNFSPAFFSNDLKFKIKYISLEIGKPSRFIAMNIDFEIFFDKYFISSVNHYLREKIGEKIKLMDYYERKQKGSYVRGEFVLLGYYADKKSLFKFID